MKFHKPAMAVAALFTAAATTAADAAKQDYPYSGLYAAARGDDCVEDRPFTNEDIDLIIAEEVQNGLTYYYAVPLHVDMKKADMQAHQVQADGSLKGFASEQMQFMGIKMIYETEIFLKPIDADHIRAYKWTVTFKESDGTVTDVIDMTKADGGNYGGEKHENLLELQPGEKGVCLKRIGEIPS